ncbi:anti-adapter protein IraP, partial [Escherichia coli]
ALLRHMEHDAQQALIQDIEQAIDQVTPCPPVNDHDAMLLQQYLKKLLRHPRS